MKQWTFFQACVLALALMLPMNVARADDEQPPEKLTEKEMFSYLDHSVAWYRQIANKDISQDRSREVVLNKSLQSSAIKFLRQSFEFARLEATILEAQQKEAAEFKEKQVYTVKQQDTAGETNLENVKVLVAQKIERIQKEITDTNNLMRRTKAAARATLAAKLEKLNHELTLAKAQQDLVTTVSTVSKEEPEEETLTMQINNLALAIPELEKKKKTTTPTDATTVATPVVAAAPVTDPTAITETPKETKGIVRLASDIFLILRESQDVQDLMEQTKVMRDEHEALLTRLRDELMYIVRRGNELSAQSAQNTQGFEAQAAEFDVLTRQFNDISTVIVPISEQKKIMENALRTLSEWQMIFKDEVSTVFSRFLVRLLGLTFAILIPILISEFSKRAVLKYVSDDRRRRQLNIMRRVILVLLIGFVIMINLMTEFGSLATFAGFVTAGLAVALQNVILSVVAYFFFFGRYGIRAGSRITVYKTTGEVIETGLVRLYLMELEEDENGKWQPTGQIVSFPNSILFQPTAFYKQVPGAKFNQREVKIPLAKDFDPKALNDKTKEIDKALFEDSRAVLEAQKIALEKSSRIKARVPRPKSSVVETEDAVLLVVRYPVPSSDKNSRMDENVLRIVSDTLERDPKVSRLNSDTPKAKSV